MLMALVTISSHIAAQSSARPHVEEILALVNAEHRWTELVTLNQEGWLEGYIKDSDGARAINDFFDQQMSWRAAEPHLVEAIMQDYSEDELARIATALAAEHGSPQPSPQYRAQYRELTSLGFRVGQQLAAPVREIVKQYPPRQRTPTPAPPEGVPRATVCSFPGEQTSEPAGCIKH